MKLWFGQKAMCGRLFGISYKSKWFFGMSILLPMSECVLSNEITEEEWNEWIK